MPLFEEQKPLYDGHRGASKTTEGPKVCDLVWWWNPWLMMVMSRPALYAFHIHAHTLTHPLPCPGSSRVCLPQGPLCWRQINEGAGT